MEANGKEDDDLEEEAGEELVILNMLSSFSSC